MFLFSYIRYYTESERKKRTHRLITRGPPPATPPAGRWRRSCKTAHSENIPRRLRLRGCFVPPAGGAVEKPAAKFNSASIAAAAPP